MEIAEFWSSLAPYLGVAALVAAVFGTIGKYIAYRTDPDRPSWTTAIRIGKQLEIWSAAFVWVLVSVIAVGYAVGV